jgi:hypothetical protein
MKKETSLLLTRLVRIQETARRHSSLVPIDHSNLLPPFNRFISYRPRVPDGINHYHVVQTQDIYHHLHTHQEPKPRISIMPILFRLRMLTIGMTIVMLDFRLIRLIHTNRGSLLLPVNHRAEDQQSSVPNPKERRASLPLMGDRLQLPCLAIHYCEITKS